MSASTHRFEENASSGAVDHPGVSQEVLIALQKVEAMEMVVRARMHDLSNELMVACSSAELASMVKDSEQKEHYLGHIRQSIKRAGKLVGSTARFARPRVADHFIPIAFDSLVEEACAIAKDIAQGRIEWRQSKDGTADARLEVLGAKGPLLQAMLSLLNNAVDAIGETPGEIHLHLESDAHTLRLFIGNDAEPITSPPRDDFFNAFVSQKPFGSGLGLTVARWIVETHGGTLAWCREPCPVTLPFVLELRLPRRSATETSPQPSTGK